MLSLCQAVRHHLDRPIIFDHHSNKKTNHHGSRYELFDSINVSGVDFWYPLLDALMCVFVRFRSHHDVCDFVPNSVIDSWEVVRRISGYEEKVGTKLFQK